MSPEEQKVDRRRGPRTAKEEPITKVAVEPAVLSEVEELRAQLAQAQEELAAAKAASDEVEQIAEVSPDAKDAVTVNFVEDGLTWLGKVWVRGEELTVAPDSKEWKELTDPRTGRLLLTLTENEQIIKWGKRMFREGKWIGEGFDLNDPSLSPEDRERLKSIQLKRQQVGLAPGEPQKRKLFNS
jgi:hypothetical protein